MIRGRKSRVRLVRFLRQAPRWLLLAALIYAPWDYGATTARGIVTLNWILGIAIGLWLVGLGWENSRVPRRILRAPRPPLHLALVALLLVIGWWMVANAKAIYDSEQHMFIRVANLLPNVPGSVDQAVSAAWMLRATGLLGTICLVADMCRDPVWLLRLWSTIGMTGGSIALLGLLQKATEAPMIFWLPVDQPVKTFFATFYYHGNAGAFLNLTLPVTCGLALRSFTRRGGAPIRALWLSLSVISGVAVFANTSRMSQILAAWLMLSLLVGLVRRTSLVARGMRWSTTALGLIVLLIAIAAVTQASRLDRSLQRWVDITETLPLDARWLAVQAALRALPDAGWLGFGPGTFHIMFPYFTAGLGERLSGFWLFLHDDYLQTLLEWGWLGGGLWACLFFGGIAVALRNRLARACSERWLPRQRLFLTLVLLGVGSAAIHALVDFPFQIASIQLYAATYLGICWGSSAWGSDQRLLATTSSRDRAE